MSRIWRDPLDTSMKIGSKPGEYELCHRCCALDEGNTVQFLRVQDDTLIGTGIILILVLQIVVFCAVFRVFLRGRQRRALTEKQLVNELSKDKAKKERL